MAASASDEVDYAEEGRKLINRTNLVVQGTAPRYSAYNKIWRHPTTNACLYVGNATTAASHSALAELNVNRIVFCQDSDGKCHFEDDPSFTYLKFQISNWRRVMGLNSSYNKQTTIDFFVPLFDFVDAELGEGNNVYIHCLAGAHRAGTAGIACLMHLCDLNSTDATRVAKELRPAINPIGNFPDLLDRLNTALDRK